MDVAIGLAPELVDAVGLSNPLLELPLISPMRWFC